MRILIIGQTPDYEALIRSTRTGERAHIEFVGYEQALEKTTMASIVFVEADAEQPLGFRVARTIMQRFPGTTLVFLMRACQFESSMLAMRMGARNILVGDEINAASLEQTLQQHAVLEAVSDRETIARNFERMIFLHSEQSEQEWSMQALNRMFSMQSGDKRFFVMLATSLDFAYSQMNSENVKKKVSSEKIKDHLLQIREDSLTIPFVFYVDQLFYIVVLCQQQYLPENPREQIQVLQQRMFNTCRPLLGEEQILLCSRGKNDFRQFRTCLDELDRLAEVMHRGSYPSMLSVYNTNCNTHSAVNLDDLLCKAQEAIAELEKGGDYEEKIRSLFAPKVVEQISYTQFIKLKEHILFAMQGLLRRSEDNENKPQIEAILEKLEMICNCSYVREQLLQACWLLTAGSGKRYHHLVSQCMKLISENYMSEISLQEMADTLNISNVYLSALFRRETGMKFSAYVKDYRLNKAKELIDAGKYPMSIIYEKVGFSNQQYFSNCFKKAYGITPGAYKKRH